MERLSNLFQGRLTAYQIATATEIDIAIIESLFDNKNNIDSLDDEVYNKLVELEQDLFHTETKNNETSA